jgi:hypothetical protein
MRSFIRLSAFASVLSLSLLATPAAAQEVTTTSVPVQSLSIKPISAIFGIYTAEYERAVSAASTLGLLGSTLGIGDVRYSTLNGKYRHYFGGTAFDGFSIAATGGVLSLELGCWSEGNGCQNERVMALGAGMELGYTFLLGERRNFSLSLDGGAQRIFPLGSVRDETDGFWFALPTGGVSIGYVLH